MDERVLRVNQLDATQLDSELSHVLQHQFIELLRGLPFSSLSHVRPELEALIRILLWRWSVWKTGATFGQLMMDLRYSEIGKETATITARSKWLLFLLLVATEWAKERVHLLASYLTTFTPSQIERGLSFIMAVTQLAELCNFFIFLLKGQFPSLKERLLSLNMVPQRRQTLNQLDYEFTNREIMWHGFSEFLFFLLPQLNFFSLRNWMRRATLILKEKFGRHQEGKDTLLSLRECGFCEDLPVLPQFASCGHVYCYYCVAANVKADRNYPCSVCGKPVYPFRSVT